MSTRIRSITATAASLIALAGIVAPAAPAQDTGPPPGAQPPTAPPLEPPPFAPPVADAAASAQPPAPIHSDPATASVPPPSIRPANFSSTDARLGGRVLTVELRCSTSGQILIRRAKRTLAKRSFTCRDGSARPGLRLSIRQADRIRAARRVSVTIRAGGQTLTKTLAIATRSRAATRAYVGGISAGAVASFSTCNGAVAVSANTLSSQQGDGVWAIPLIYDWTTGRWSYASGWAAADGITTNYVAASNPYRYAYVWFARYVNGWQYAGEWVAITDNLDNGFC